VNTKDPFLEGRGISTNESRFSFPLITEAVISVVDANINLVWVMAEFKKTKTPRFIIEHIQHFFSDEDMRAKDQLWKEHCAGDLREFTDNDFGRNFCRFLSNVPKQSDTGEENQKLYTFIRNTRDFLNDFHHLNATALDKARVILNEPTRTSIDDNAFDKICVEYITALHNLFKFKKR